MKFFYRIFDLLLKIFTLFIKSPPRIGLGPMSYWDGNPQFPNIIFEHPRCNTFKKYRSQDLAPIRFTNPNFNHRAMPHRASDSDPFSVYRRWRFCECNVRVTRYLYSRYHNDLSKGSQKLIIWGKDDIWKL